MSPHSDTSGRSVAPRQPDVDSLAALCAAHAPVSTNGHFPSGTVFGDWRLTAFIGRGGNGEVYCAEHAALGTPAAVKVLMRDDERAKARFAREAQLLASLRSASFPRFFAYGEVNGHPYLAMELLEPGDLPTGDHAVARFLLKMCDAVGELHVRGLIHRDIKPGNILWRPAHSRAAAEPVLADLGLVKEIPVPNHQTTQPPNDQTTIGGVGTPGYGAPEQMERGEATAASDIHALGVLADRCFAGKPPRAWARIIQRATSSIPAQRYQSVVAFARAIKWRHQRWHVIGVTLFLVALVGVMNVGFPSCQTRDGNEARKWESLCKRGRIESVTTLYEPLDERHPRYPGYSVRSVTNSTEGTILNLPTNVVSFAQPIQLQPGEYRIIGPGRLDADISGPSNVIIRLKECVFNNMTRLPYPKNGIRYELEGGAYLNFANLKETYKYRMFVHSDSDAPNVVRFRGPMTIAELNEERNRESDRILFPAAK